MSSQRYPVSILILAAGKGERMRSETPKALQSLGGRPLLAQALETARSLGPKRVVVLIGHKANEIRKRFSEEKGVTWAVQRPQLGTAHALLAAKKSIRPSLENSSTPLFILYVDVPLLRPETLRKMQETFEVASPSLVLLTAQVEDPTGYGRIVRNDLGEIERIVEEREATPAEREIREINTGIYLAAPRDIFPPLEKVKRSVTRGEYYLTDLVTGLLAEGKKVASVVAPDPTEITGINTKNELAAAERVLQRRIRDRWMLTGVTFLQPESNWIGADVTLAPDVVVHPGAVISGKTRIGPGAEILSHSVIDHSLVEAGARIGPFAHLRPGTVVRAGAHVGNFVELKKTTLGRGAKANHLTYLGDSVIGAGANVGAGTITCNYDGLAKHKTIIGENAFIGSDTQLVAPVRVGRNAWVGAGTTITKNVPPKSLALSRVEQVNIRNWRKKGK